MDYLHNDTDESLLTLHDCRADRVELRDGVLSFWFTDGFWVTEDHPENPTGKTVRTGAARVDYVLRREDGDDISVCVFRDLRWPWSFRSKWELQKLLEAMNDKGWELEFLYQYPGGWERIIEGWFWLPRRPWHLECQLKLDCAKVIYRWNEYRADAQW